MLQTTTTTSESEALEHFSYDDGIVRMFVTATIFWGFVGTAAGVLVGVLLAAPWLVDGLRSDIAAIFSFARLRPLHTNAAIFAFAGNAIFAAVYYSTQRLCKARMWSDVLSRLHFWGWQAIIVAAAVTLPLGITQGKEYAELEWPIDLAIAVVWLLFFGGNFMMTLLNRRERHMYVALWFYIATIVTVTVLHVFNSLVVPIGLGKSYSIYAGVQDAFMQWWYGHNAVAFFLTTPFLGLMYYFLPKAAERPVFSYKLSIIHFWSLVFIYIWAGPHHLHYTALPEWASTFGMLFSVMLWMPSWGGMINGLLTLRGAWHKVTTDPVLKFFVVGITFYGMATFEGPMLSIKSVNALSHYTDWTIAHVHSGALGWNGFMTFGMIYWLLPRLYQTKLWSTKMAEWHFWIGTIGILLYIIPIYAAGITQGLMWRALKPNGDLLYTFLETVQTIVPFWWTRVGAGVLYVLGVVMLAINAVMTWSTRPKTYEVPVYSAPRLSAGYVEPVVLHSNLDGTPVLELATKIDKVASMDWHRRWEHWPVRFTIFTVLAVLVASAFEMIPMFLIRSNIPTINTVKPYTPLELAGRDIYVAEGCYNCHSQMIRPMVAEKLMYGEFSKAGESVYDHPFQWGSRRIGPDLARIGIKQTSGFWHWSHFENPSFVSEGSVMPSYRHLLEERLNYNEIEPRVRAAQFLGAKYDFDPSQSADIARQQAEKVAAEIVAQSGQVEYNGHLIKDSTAIALIAYLQRLGTDLFKPEEPVATPAAAPVMEATADAATPDADAGAQ
ncbi:MAG: cytochrome-c oxidase, cbb3-type subunit I [Pirellula sp.]